MKQELCPSLSYIEFILTEPYTRYSDSYTSRQAREFDTDCLFTQLYVLICRRILERNEPDEHYKTNVSLPIQNILRRCLFARN
jgi:hypothetical protein